jgi:hypothetical protein
MNNPVGAQCAPTYSTPYNFKEGAQHEIFTDEFKCMANSVGDTLLSTGSNSISSSPASNIVSPMCATSLTVTSSGNVVLADVTSGKTFWTTSTNGSNGPFRLTIQNDGNLVLSDSTSKSLWTSGTAGVGCAPYSLKIRDQLHLTVVDCNDEPLWMAKF